MRQISMETRREILCALAQRYRHATRAGKTRTIDEVVAITGYHRKHAIRLLNRNRLEIVPDTERRGVGRRVYDRAVREALILIWEAADRICGRRLKVVIPRFVESMERNRHLTLDPVVREKIFAISAATIDRLLRPIRAEIDGRRKRRRRSNPRLKNQVRVRTFSEWKEVLPGHCEADFVAHNGGITTGSCVHSFVITDVFSGWIEILPLVARQQGLVVEAIECLREQLPVKLLGLNTDNDSAFMNETVIEHCKTSTVQLTRSRAYRKNDQAWIEQKNGSVVRKLVGYGRFTGLEATHTLGRLYQLSRLYVNFFQPSFKLRSKTRHGSKVTKTYFKPATPCDRLLNEDSVPREVKERLQRDRSRLDPVQLLHGIRDLQGMLAALVNPTEHTHGECQRSQDLDAFLAALPRLWRSGEARPTHRAKPRSPRTWRTRPDDFKDVWGKVLGWLQDNPEVTAKELFERLQKEHPGTFRPGQLRTLQRRVRDWRQAMARELIYAGRGEVIERVQCG